MRRSAAAPPALPGHLIVEEWPIERLVDYEKNPRVNDHAVPAMVANLREFGFRVPVLAKSDGVVIDGHLRLKAARVIGMTTVPVALADDLSATQVKAFRIAVNKSAEWADWDDDLLRSELSDLRIEGFDLALTGFDMPELATLFSDPDEAGPEIAKSGAGSLAERFGVPPFTVLSARDGWWQDRKRAWIALGIQSELGRGDNLGEIQGAIERREAIRGKPPARPDATPGGGADALNDI